MATFGLGNNAGALYGNSAPVNTGGVLAGKALAKVTNAVYSDKTFIFTAGTNVTHETMALAKAQLLSLYQSNTETAKRMRAIEASGQSVTILVGGYLPPGAVGTCEPLGSIFPASSFVVYDPSYGGWFQRNGKYYTMDGLATLAHEIGGHAYDNATRNRKVRFEAEATRLENEIRYLQGYPMTKTYGSNPNEIPNYDLYARPHY